MEELSPYLDRITIISAGLLLVLVLIFLLLIDWYIHYRVHNSKQFQQQEQALGTLLKEVNILKKALNPFPSTVKNGKAPEKPEA